HPVCQHCRRVARGGAGQHPLPDLVPGCPDAVRHDLCAQYGGRGDSAAFPQEGVPAMSSATTPVPGTGPQPVAAAPPIPPPRRPRARGRLSLLAHGLPMVWMNGGALAVCLAMILGLLALVLYQGFGTFWPVPSLQVRTIDGKVYLGEVVRDSTYRPEPGVF